MDTRKLNILLADDDTDDCNFFKEALEDLKLPVHLTTVRDGEQLMELLTKDSKELPDVLFLDINMPRKNGHECLAEIKHNKKLKGLSVVMFSTSNSPDKIQMTFKSGAHIYIHKPGDFSQLKEVIRHALPIATGGSTLNKHVKYILNA
jgi:CheY-like chemotaxis protein